jgi:hypothetical protein
MTFFTLNKRKSRSILRAEYIAASTLYQPRYFFTRKADLLLKKQSASIIYFSNNIDVDPKFYFSNKLSTARPGAVKAASGMSPLRST